MAAVTAAVVAGVATVGGAAMQSRAAGRAAGAQAAGNRAAIAEQQRQYDQTRQDMEPWRLAGADALQRQTAFLNGDWSGFQNSPDYKWAVDQGFKGLDRGAAANGSLYSGGTDADRIALGQGLATQYANNYWNRLAGLSNTGQNTAAQIGQFGQSAANNISGLMQNTGAARASAYQQQGAAWSNALNGLSGIGAWYLGQRKPGG